MRECRLVPKEDRNPLLREEADDGETITSLIDGRFPDTLVSTVAPFVVKFLDRLNQFVGEGTSAGLLFKILKRHRID